MSVSAQQSTHVLAGHKVVCKKYAHFDEEANRERRFVEFVGNNFSVQLMGEKYGEPFLLFESMAEDSHVRLSHSFKDGFSTHTSSSHDMFALTEEIKEAAKVLEWAEALYADWERYFSHML